MMRYPLVLLAAAAMTACDAAPPPPAAVEAKAEVPADMRPVIWRGARKGMTVGEVRAVLPEVVATPDGADYGSVKQLLALPDHTLGTQRFAVEFLFEPPGRLFQVSLKWKPTSKECGPLEAAAREAVSLIRADADTEILFDERSDGANGYGLRGEWLGDQHVVMVLAGCTGPDSDADLGLVYRAQEAPAPPAESPFSARTTPR